MDYKDYWGDKVWENRETRNYYGKLYDKVKHRFKVDSDEKILDVGGGDGHFLSYLGIKDATILDISESGIQFGMKLGYNMKEGDVQEKFPFEKESFDVVFCCEVLEHLKDPDITVSEILKVLKTHGTLFVAQPNMRSDGVHHVRRFYKKDIISLLTKHGFAIDWIDYVPAFSVPEAIISDIKKTRSIFRKIKQSVAFLLSFLPYKARYILAELCPNRFALMFIVKAKRFQFS